MNRRLFIAINLPENIKKELKLEIDRIEPLFFHIENDIKFIPSNNWHITLSFLGDQDESVITGIINAIEETKLKFDQPIIRFEKIYYGPDDKRPKMIWLKGDKETSKNLSIIKNELEDNLVKNGIRFQRENRLFSTHITLARFSYIKSSLPALEENFSFSFSGKELDLMESHLKRSGAEYDILSSFAFKKEMD